MIRNIYITFLGIIMVLPFDVNGITSNYLYTLLPVLQLPLNSLSFVKFQVSSYTLIILSVFGATFVCALALAFMSESNYENIAVGGSIFFITYVFPVLLRLDTKILNGLITGIIVFSIMYSLAQLSSFLLGNVYGAEAKDLVGSQRIGFLINFSLFYILSNVVCAENINLPMADLKGVKRVLILFILLLGVLITFSRASLIAFLVTILFIPLSFKRCNLNLIFITIRKNYISALVLLFIILVTISSSDIGHLLSFYDARLFSGYLGSTDAVLADLNNPNSSGGTRIAINTFAINFLVSHPLIGNSFNGLSRITEWGSLHNQYIDILVRAGVILGGSVIIFLVMMFFKFFNAPSHSLLKHMLLPFLSTIIYGFFHETFRESQGAFLYLIYAQSYFLPLRSKNYLIR